jgi:transposase InsO family protein
VRTAGSRHGLPVCSDILYRQFHAEGVGEKRVSDIAYLRAAGRRACLTAALDLYGRKAIGRALSGDTEAGHKDGVCQPGGPGGAGIPFGPGARYCAASFRNRLRDRRPAVRQSVSRKGNRRDNACAETFFKTLKREPETAEGGYGEAGAWQSVFMCL